MQSFLLKTKTESCVYVEQEKIYKIIKNTRLLMLYAIKPISLHYKGLISDTQIKSF